MARSKDLWFKSNDDTLIGIGGMEIYNDRNKSDYALLASYNWSDILVGIDGYPIKDKNSCYLIGGGRDKYLKTTAIEFFGVKTNDEPSGKEVQKSSFIL